MPVTSVTPDKEDADLGLQLSYVASTYYFSGYYNNGPWWNYYPGYWIPGYWGGYWGGGWYYPYSITYSYSTGSLLADLVNLGAPEGAKEKLPVVWNAYISGLIGSSGSLNVNRATTAINQAFCTKALILKKINKINHFNKISKFMKTIKYFTYRIMAVAAIAIAFALPAKAQITPMTYF